MRARSLNIIFYTNYYHLAPDSRREFLACRGGYVYEPKVILIGGGMSNAGVIITNIVKKHLKEKSIYDKVITKNYDSNTKK